MLLFIPLLFFIGCEEEDNNDDNSAICLEGSWSIQSFDNSGYDYLLCFFDYVSGACGEFDQSCYDFVFESNNYFHALADGEFFKWRYLLSRLSNSSRIYNYNRHE